MLLTLGKLFPFGLSDRNMQSKYIRLQPFKATILTFPQPVLTLFIREVLLPEGLQTRPPHALQEQETRVPRRPV